MRLKPPLSSSSSRVSSNRDFLAGCSAMIYWVQNGVFKMSTGKVKRRTFAEQLLAFGADPIVKVVVKATDSSSLPPKRKHIKCWTSTFKSITSRCCVENFFCRAWLLVVGCSISHSMLSNHLFGVFLLSALVACFISLYYSLLLFLL